MPKVDQNQKQNVMDFFVDLGNMRAKAIVANPSKPDEIGAELYRDVHHAVAPVSAADYANWCANLNQNEWVTRDMVSFKLGQQTLYYAVGDTALELHTVPALGAQKYTADYLGAMLGRMVAAFPSVFQSGENYDIALYTLCPVGYLSAYSANLITALKRNWKFHIGMDKDPIGFNVVSVQISEEPLGGGFQTICRRGRNNNIVYPYRGQNVVVIDVGGGTYQFVTFRDTKPGDMASHNEGLRDTMDAFARLLRQDHPQWFVDMRAIPERELVNAARTGKMRVLGQMRDVSEQWKKAAKPLVDRITRTFRAKYSVGTSVISLSGGGGYLLREMISEALGIGNEEDERSFRGQVVLPHDDESLAPYFNLMGVYHIVQMGKGRR